MKLRSLLFVPGDSEKKLEKAMHTGADALIIDLEDSVDSASKFTARGLTSLFLRNWPRQCRKSELWVRINPIDTTYALDDLAAIVGGAPSGIMLPKASGVEDVKTLSFYLEALEAQANVERGSIGIIPVTTETASAPFKLGGYAEAKIPRLRALTWGAEDLSAAIGATGNLDNSGQWSLTYRIARSLTLLAAYSAGVQALETLYTDFRDETGLRATSVAAYAEGFTGRIAIHPAQVSTINDSFLPSEADVAQARRVIAAFDAAPGFGTVGLDGKMLDAPHLKQARSVLDTSAHYNRGR